MIKRSVVFEKCERSYDAKKTAIGERCCHTGVFPASNMAATITGCTVDVTAGTTAAINYDVTQIAFLKERNSSV